MRDPFRRSLLTLYHRASEVAIFLVAGLGGLWVHSLGVHGQPETGALATLGAREIAVLALGLLAWTSLRLPPYGADRYAGAREHLKTGLRRTALAVSAVAVAGVLCASAVLVSRGFLLSFGSALFGLHVARQVLNDALFVRLRKRGRNLRIALVVGSGPRAQRMISGIRAHPEYGYHIIGYVDDSFSSSRPDLPHLGELVNLAKILGEKPVDEVFIALPMRSQYDTMLEAIRLCEALGIRVHLSADFFSLAIARSHPSELSGEPVISIDSQGPMDGVPYLLKWIFDRVVAALLLLAGIPVFAAISLLILASMGRPVLFKQSRAGFHRRPFDCYKFRTMVQDADERMSALEPFNEMDGPVFKIQDDPRVTRLGRWLRTFSLDELPQLLNVLTGEMSLVGPRPLPLRDVARFDRPAFHRRFAVRPGMTCTWQVSGRNELSFEDWIRLDLEYIDRWSLWLDARILLKTIGALLRGRGAY